MHNIKSFAIVLSLAAVLAACTEDRNEPTAIGNNGKTEMMFTLSHPSQTRATDTSFEQGDAVGLYVAEASAPLEIAGNVVNNERLVFSGTKWVADHKLYWDNGSYNVYAYYPQMSHVSSVTDLPFQVSTDQTVEGSQETDGYEASDLLYSSALGVAASADPVNLMFRHIMSKLSIRLIKGEDYEGEIPADAIVYVHNTVTDATVDLTAGVATRDPRGTRRTVTARRNSQANYSAIIVPQRLDNRVPLIEVVANGVSFLYESKFVFKPGMHHIVNLVMDKNPEQIKIEIGGEITNWN
ncbi:MAG: fimbrillin family protein [Muribaculaceae bacterium]|nr:fimbrillin family protein [Muribaculaceae bacterium]